MDQESEYPMFDVVWKTFLANVNSSETFINSTAITTITTAPLYIKYLPLFILLALLIILIAGSVTLHFCLANTANKNTRRIYNLNSEGYDNEGYYSIITEI